MLQLIVGNVYSRVHGDINDAISFQITKRLTYRLKDAYYVAGAVNRKREAALRAMGLSVAGANRWDGSVALFWPQTKQFFTGMMAEVRAVLDESGVPYQIVDRREKPEQNLPHMTFTYPQGGEQRPYQDLAVQQMYRATRGILQSATGSGKTLMVTRLIGEIKTAPFLFLVLSVDLMDQACETLSQCLNVPIGRIGSGRCEIQGINVMTIQTAVRALNRNNAKFDTTNFQFDDEDEWEEADVVSQHGDKIENLIRTAKGVYFDECLSGKTTVITDKGSIPISDVVKSQSRLVLSHDGEKLCFKPILNWWNKGKKPIIKIDLENGESIFCTKNHLFATKNGWVESGNLTVGTNVLAANTGCLDGAEGSLKEDTKWLAVKYIADAGEEFVYDIEVEDTHCFFANGILVHNCHHVSSETCKEVLFAAKDAYWRYGGSATPFREDGAEMMIQALFGRPLIKIPASWLIQNNYLVRPYIFNVKIKDGDAGHFHSYKKVYKECIVNNRDLNRLVVQIVEFLEMRGISNLTLVQHYDHGYNLQEFKPDFPFIKGDMAKKGRKIGIQDLRDGKIKSAIATTLADEGLDVRRLGGVIVAGGGKSITRIYQRIGRVLRPFKDKKIAIAIVFHHDGKHLKKHGARVRNLLKQEEEFVVVDSSPDKIFEDLSAVLDSDGTLLEN